MNLRQLVNNRDVWEDFLRYLDQEIQKSYKNLSTLADHDDLMREQGKVKAFERMKRLRDEVNSK